MKQNPIVSVLMPVYNGEKYLSEAIESVLNQTFTDYEFIIINDGSTDRSKQIILRYIKNEKRIRLLENEKNLGLVQTLNKGLELARGVYIARMDADDICHQDRFLKQVRYMNNYPEVAICGTSYQTFGAKKATYILPVEHDAIKVGLIFGPSICHPSVFIRSSFIKSSGLQYLSETFPAEDYKIWVNTAKLEHLHNLSEVLLFYREHELQISTENKQWQKKQTDKIRLEVLDWLYSGFSEEQKQFHINVFIPKIITNKQDLKSFSNWSQKLMASNKELKNFSTTLLKRNLKNHLRVATLKWIQKNYFAGCTYNIRRLLVYWRSGLILKVSLKQNLKIFIKSTIG